MNISRYAKINKPPLPREIVLLKAFPCKWAKCTFCDYIHDNSVDENEINSINREILNNVSGCFNALQVINSGSCFEIPSQSLNYLKNIVIEKNIHKLFFEAHWMYRHRLNEFRDFFGVPISFITGIETFDEYFRNKVLKKGIHFDSIQEVKKYFQSVCIMVGIKGQTKEMINNDLKIVMDNFEHATINIFVNNSTHIKADPELIQWFKNEYEYLLKSKNVDLLLDNTDFGVGGPL